VARNARSLHCGDSVCNEVLLPCWDDSYGRRTSDPFRPLALCSHPL